MSTNIDHWETIAINGLVVPWSAVSPSYNATHTGLYTIELDLRCEDGMCVGYKHMNRPDDPDPMFIFQGVRVRGEASGWAFADMLIPLLKQSLGTFDALAFWERGEWISRLQARDGQITETVVNVGAILKELDTAKALIMRLAPPDNITDPAERLNWLLQSNGVNVTPYTALRHKIIAAVEEPPMNDNASRVDRLLEIYRELVPYVQK